MNNAEDSTALEMPILVPCFPPVWLFGIQQGFRLKGAEGGRPRYLPSVGGGGLPLRLLLRRGWGGVGCLLLLRSGRAVGLRSGSTVGGDRLSLGLSVALWSRLDLLGRTIDSVQKGLWRTSNYCITVILKKDNV